MQGIQSPGERDWISMLKQRRAKVGASTNHCGDPETSMLVSKTQLRGSEGRTIRERGQCRALQQPG